MMWRLIAIGGSLGGARSAGKLLADLPESFSVPIAIVLHRSENAGDDLAGLLQKRCRLPVREAGDKEPMAPGIVYVAPAGYHLLAEGDHFALSTDEPVNFARPSIDVLFESAMACYGPKTIGIILSGTGNDGADGLKKIIAHGGTGLVEAPDEAESPEMPQAALDANPEAKVMRIDEMASFLMTRLFPIPKKEV